MDTHAKVLQWLADQNIILEEENTVLVEHDVNAKIVTISMIGNESGLDAELVEERANNFHAQAVGTPFKFQGHAQLVQMIKAAIEADDKVCEVSEHEFL